MERDIFKEFAELQIMKDKILIEIGLLFANYTIEKKNSAEISIINDKVLVFQQIDEKLRKLENELGALGTA